MHGLDLRFLPDNAAVRAIAPALSADVLAASFCPTDGHANPIKATRAFADSARRHGAAIREGVAAVAIRVARDRVTGVDTSAGFIAADRVIVAAGVDTPALLSPLGLDLPLSRKVVSVVQTEPLPPCLDPVFGVANADCAGRQEVGGRLRFSGGRSDGSLDPVRWLDASAPPAEIVHELIAHVAHVLPSVRDARIARTWEGWIDLTPDALPVLDAPAPLPDSLSRPAFRDMASAWGRSAACCAPGGARAPRLNCGLSARDSATARVPDARAIHR